MRGGVLTFTVLRSLGSFTLETARKCVTFTHLTTLRVLAEPARASLPRMGKSQIIQTITLKPAVTSRGRSGGTPDRNKGTGK